MDLNLLHQTLSGSAKCTRQTTSWAHLTGPREMESQRCQWKLSSASCKSLGKMAYLKLFLFTETFPKTSPVIYINNSLHLAQKYVQIMVCGHFLFWEANGFPRAKFEENCGLWGDDVFSSQMETILLLSFTIFHNTRGFQNWRPGEYLAHDAFCPIRCKEKYLMDYY